MSDRVSLLPRGNVQWESADWNLRDYKSLSHLANASAWHLPYKIYTPDFAVLLKFCKRLKRVALMPFSEISGIYLITGSDTCEEVSEEQYQKIEKVMA